MMTLNDAFAKRVRQILESKKMKLSHLEQATGLYHSTLNCLMNGKYEASNFKTMALIIRELGLSMSEFFDSPVFDFDNFDFEQ